MQTRKHQEKFKEVMNDVGNMESIMTSIMPNTAWDLHPDRTLDMFHRIKIHDMFQEKMVKTVHAMYHIERDSDIYSSLEKKIIRICKICNHLKDSSKKTNWIRIYAWYVD